MIQRPHYNLHQIDKGLYANKGMYIDEYGNDYEGLYHRLPNGKMFTNEIPSANSMQLFEKNNHLTTSVITYNKIKEYGYSAYTSPIYVQPKITALDIQSGIVTRYFVQKRSSPRNTIMEIDVEQYNTINKKNYPGINGIIWNSVSLDWYIHLKDKSKIIELNTNTVIKIEPSFPGIKKYLSNLLEYSV